MLALFRPLEDMSREEEIQDDPQARLWLMPGTRMREFCDRSMSRTMSNFGRVKLTQDPSPQEGCRDSCSEAGWRRAPFAGASSAFPPRLRPPLAAPPRSSPLSFVTVAIPWIKSLLVSGCGQCPKEGAVARLPPQKPGIWLNDWSRQADGHDANTLVSEKCQPSEDEVPQCLDDLLLSPLMTPRVHYCLACRKDGFMSSACCDVLQARRAEQACP